MNPSKDLEFEQWKQACLAAGTWLVKRYGCHNCGALLEKRYKFCHECGEKLVSDV